MRKTYTARFDLLDTTVTLLDTTVTTQTKLIAGFAELVDVSKTPEEDR